MILQDIKQRLESASIFHSETEIGGKPAVVGYEKKFRWAWFATQLNTFVIAVDFGSQLVTEEVLQGILKESFAYAKENYRGWPRGLQSGVGVIVIAISEDIDEAAARYCTELKSGKKWAGFSVPVAIDARSGEVHAFSRNPLWGKLYYPHFKKLIKELTGS